MMVLCRWPNGVKLCILLGSQARVEAVELKEDRADLVLIILTYMMMRMMTCTVRTNPAYYSVLFSINLLKLESSLCAKLCEHVYMFVFLLNMLHQA